MATQVQIRGAASGTQNARTLAARELDVDTTNRRIAVHDGVRAGGYHMANYFDVQNQAFSYVGASGTNAITATYAPVPSAYAAGQSFKFKAAATNTGAVTLNVNSLGAKNVYKRDKASGSLVALVAGDIINGGVYTVDYDGTQFQLISDSAAVSGGVAFRARKSGTQSISAALTKVTFDTEDYDTSAYFDNATNYRFTPLVAGYYALKASCSLATASSSAAVNQIFIYINGSPVSYGSSFSNSNLHKANLSVSTDYYFNGSTDYAEVFATPGVLSDFLTGSSFSGFRILGL